MLSIYRLPNQLPGEKIIKVVRRDVFILFKKIIFFILLTILPFLFFYFILFTNLRVMSGVISYPLLVLGASAYYLFIWLFFFFSFIDYYLDIWIITSHRIIDIQQQGFFSRVVAENKLFRIQDVTSEVHGIIPTLLSYGDIYVQTAGTKERFYFRQVPEPDKIRDLIIKLVENNKRKNQEIQERQK